jgi:hypothetical protein
MTRIAIIVTPVGRDLRVLSKLQPRSKKSPRILVV